MSDIYWLKFKFLGSNNETKKHLYIPMIKQGLTRSHCCFVTCCKIRMNAFKIGNACTLGKTDLEILQHDTTQPSSINRRRRKLLLLHTSVTTEIPGTQLHAALN
jgi:hypothetical protein